MKKIASSLRAAFLFLALIATVIGFLPSQADAVKSCEFYCGPAGPYTCYVTSTMICPYLGFD